MWFVKKEIPIWPINWVNRIFYLGNNPANYVSCIIDWKARNINSIFWKKVLVDVAPMFTLVCSYLSYDVEWDMCVEFIDKEIPAWRVDWVNNTFVLRNEIYKIDEILYEWWRTLDSNNIKSIDNIVLTMHEWYPSIPSSSIQVSYYAITDYKNNSISKVRLMDIKDKIKELLNNKIEPIDEEYLLEKINEVSKIVWSGKYNDILWETSLMLNYEKLWFKKRRQTLKTKWNRIIMRKTNIWDKEIYIQTNNLDHKWYIIVWDEILEYTKKDDTKLYLKEGIQNEYNAWTNVAILHELENNTWEILSVFKFMSSVYYFSENDIPLYKWEIEYKVYDIENKQYILLDIPDANHDIQINYIRKFIPLVNDFELCHFSDDFWIIVVAKLTVWLIAKENSIIDEEIKKIVQEWYNSLQDLYKLYDYSNWIKLKDTFRSYY